MKYIQYWLGKPSAELTAGDVETFVSRGTGAGRNLAYAEPMEALGRLAEHICALANDEGGLLLLGVEVERVEERGRLVGIQPRLLRGLPDWNWPDFRAHVLERISPPVEGIDIQAIGLPGGGVVVLLDIPQSSTGVHRAPNGRYYGRRGFLSVPLEEGQVEALRARRGRPKLLPRLEIANIDAPTHRLALRVQLDNRGRREAANPRVRLRLLGARVTPKLPPGAIGSETTPSGEVSWTVSQTLEAGQLMTLGELPVRHEGDFAVEVEAACEGLPAETTYFLVSGEIPAEVQRLLSGNQGWEVPPADRAEVLRLWPKESRPARRASLAQDPPGGGIR